MQTWQERFDFLAKYRHTVPEEDFEVAMKAYEWPKKFVSIMKEAAAKATSGTQDMHSKCRVDPLCIRLLCGASSRLLQARLKDP